MNIDILMNISTFNVDYYFRTAGTKEGSVNHRVVYFYGVFEDGDHSR